MKKFFFFAALLCCIVSCTKDNSDYARNSILNGGNSANSLSGIIDSSNTSWYIKGKIDGVSFRYFTGVTATCKKAGQDVTSIVLSAYAERTAKTASMTLVIGNGTANINAGSYSEFDLNSLAAGGWSATVTEAYMSARSKGNPFILTVTSINEHEVKGTFKGDIFLTDANAKVDESKKKQVTEGEFVMKYRD